jgi:F0F1-type ATP synthase membrane subunit b/b'
VAAQAGGVAETARGEAGRVGEEAKAQTRNVVEETKVQLREQARQQTDRATTVLEGLAIAFEP